jgi:hypothetical protein
VGSCRFVGAEGGPRCRRKGVAARARGALTNTPPTALRAARGPGVEREFCLLRVLAVVSVAQPVPLVFDSQRPSTSWQDLRSSYGCCGVLSAAGRGASRPVPPLACNPGTRTQEGWSRTSDMRGCPPAFLQLVQGRSTPDLCGGLSPTVSHPLEMFGNAMVTDIDRIDRFVSVELSPTHISIDLADAYRAVWPIYQSLTDVCRSALSKLRRYIGVDGCLGTK